MKESTKEPGRGVKVTRREIIKRTISTAAGSYFLLKSSKTAEAVAAAGPVSEAPGVPPGASYEATVPDTLDLAERARLALRSLTGTLDPENRDGFSTRFIFR